MFLISLVAQNDAARILAVLPTPSISHQVVFRPLTEELAKRGHEVVVITADAAFPKGQAPANLTEIDIHDMSYEIWRKEFVSSPVAVGNGDDWPVQADHLFTTVTKLFEKQMMLDEVRSVIFDETKKFDLLFIEACVIAALGISHVHQVPVIQISSFGALPPNVLTIGAPLHVFQHPTSSQQRVNKLTIWEKLKELYNYYRLSNVFDRTDRLADEVLKRSISPTIPPIHELKKNVEMLFLNVHPLWEMNRPVPPNVIYMGGLHQKPEKDLPQDLKSYLDSSKNGVIYISFGTNVEPALLPPERIQTIINVFSGLTFDVLWKWNKDVLPGRTDNIKIAKWLPQSDMLKHPKVKLFITQAGLQSTDEAITAGVPLIGIPMLGDQWYNADLYEHYKIGKRIDLARITEENLGDAINAIISDESYRKNIAKLRAVMSDMPEKPLERAVWWTEYMLRHGGAKHLLSPIANISWTQYLELELVLYLCLALTSVIISVVLVASFVRKRYGVMLKLKTS